MKAATASLLLFGLAVAPAQSAQTAGSVPDGDAPPRPGDRGVVLTAVQGDTIEEIPLRYLGLQRNFIGPGYDLHLVQLEGPIADRVGVAAGMSGSPVYIDGRLIGALAYRLGLLPSEPVAGVTPIEDMLQADRRAPSTRAATSSLGAPIGTPVHVGGLTGPVRDWAAAQLEELGFVVVSGGAADADAPIGGELRPGSPVGVELIRGDLAVAATGTVTLVDGDRVFAFGHPFLGRGRLEMPMVSASVVHTLADLAGSVKLARVGDELGAFLEDRLTAIVGRTGHAARMIPLDLAVRGASYDEQRFHFEVARSSLLSPLLAAVAVANSLSSNAGYEPETTMLIRGRIRIAGYPELPLEMAAAGAGGRDPVLGIAVMLQQTLASLWLNPFTEVEVEALDLEVSVRPAVRSYEVEALHYDRRPLRPGETLVVECSLRTYRGAPQRRKLEIVLPADLPPRARLALAVGAPEQVDRALGQPFARRLRSAADLGAVIRILGERRSSHRLTAVLFQRAPGVVSGGVAYGELPPTAERLLAARAGQRRLARTAVSGLAHAELELDGPVAGVVVVRVDVASDLDAQAELEEDGKRVEGEPE